MLHLQRDTDMVTRFCLTLTFLFIVTPQTNAAFGENAWSFWSLSDETAEAEIDHQSWSNFLMRYVLPNDDGINYVAYAAVTPEDRESLQSYIDQITAQDPRKLRKAEQLAYWVNLYNALTVEVVLRNPGKDSIRDMGKGYFSSGPWSDKLIKIADQSLSLDDIEHRILRPIWRDHRIHYAVNCASISCPNLATTAYTADNANKMFDIAELQYINHARGARFDERGRLTLSSIYEWYAGDFADDEEDLVRYISTHHSTATAELREYTGRVRYKYD